MNDRSGAALPGVPAASWAAIRPELTSENERVYAAWHFCGGWKPELLAIAAAFHGFDDELEFLAGQLMAMRDALAAREAARLAAPKGKR